MIETIEKMSDSHQYTPTQRLLMRLRKEQCGDNSAELARQIGKDATYVHRLFYPIGKKGGKGIGLEIMQACSAKFNLPPGYWEQTPRDEPMTLEAFVAQENKHVATEPQVSYLLKPELDRRTKEAMELFARMNDAQKDACLQYLRGFAAAIGPLQDGQTLQVAG